MVAAGRDIEDAFSGCFIEDGFHNRDVGKVSPAVVGGIQDVRVTRRHVGIVGDDRFDGFTH